MAEQPILPGVPDGAEEIFAADGTHRGWLITDGGDTIYAPVSEARSADGTRRITEAANGRRYVVPERGATYAWTPNLETVTDVEGTRVDVESARVDGQGIHVTGRVAGRIRDNLQPTYGWDGVITHAGRWRVETAAGSYEGPVQHPDGSSAATVHGVLTEMTRCVSVDWAPRTIRAQDIVDTRPINTGEREATFLQRARERREQREKASQRAEELFLSLLSPAQRDQVHRHNRVTVIGSEGNRFTIDLSATEGNIHWLGPDGVTLGLICAAPRARDHAGERIVPRDQHIGQMLALISDEKSFMETANRYGGEFPTYDPPPVNREERRLAERGGRRPRRNNDPYVIMTGRTIGVGRGVFQQRDFS